MIGSAFVDGCELQQFRRAPAYLHWRASWRSPPTSSRLMIDANSYAWKCWRLLVVRDETPGLGPWLGLCANCDEATGFHAVVVDTLLIGRLAITLSSTMPLTISPTKGGEAQAATNLPRGGRPSTTILQWHEVIARSPPFRALGQPPKYVRHNRTRTRLLW